MCVGVTTRAAVITTNLRAILPAMKHRISIYRNLRTVLDPVTALVLTVFGQVKVVRVARSAE